MYLAREFLVWLMYVLGVALFIALLVGLVFGLGYIYTHFGVGWFVGVLLGGLCVFCGTLLYRDSL